MIKNNMWYGYRHQNGTLHAKRMHDKQDLEEARQSPFVVEIFGPWPCQDREEAVGKIRIETGP